MPSSLSLTRSGSCGEYRSVAPAQSNIGEEAGGLVVESPAGTDANLEVRRDQEVNAGADIVASEILSFAGRKDPEVLGVNQYALANGDFEHDRGGPVVEMVCAFNSGSVAERRIDHPAARQFPP